MNLTSEPRRMSAGKRMPRASADVYRMKSIKFGADQIVKIDEWRSGQRPIPAFTEAVRQLIDIGLKG